MLLPSAGAGYKKRLSFFLFFFEEFGSSFIVFSHTQNCRGYLITSYSYFRSTNTSESDTQRGTGPSFEPSSYAVILAV